MKKQERILISAIWYKDLETSRIKPVNVDNGLVLCGFRHDDIISQMFSLGKRTVFVDVGEYEQGFLTSENRFVDRIEAKEIAIKSDQLIRNRSSDRLFSEDLW